MGLVGEHVLVPFLTFDFTWNVIELYKGSIYVQHLNTSPPHPVEVVETLGDHVDSLPEVLLGDNQRRGKANATRIASTTAPPNTREHSHINMSASHTPRLFRSRQNCHAVFPLALLASSMTIAFSRPLPRTCCTSGDFNAAISLRKISPSVSARSESFSSTRTWITVMATAHPRGLLHAKEVSGG